MHVAGVKNLNLILPHLWLLILSQMKRLRSTICPTKTNLPLPYLQIESFLHHVLKGNQRTHKIDPTQTEIIHIGTFPKEGLEKVIAYSDKRYPKRIEPNYYEHFTLFALEYEDEAKALRAFATFRRLVDNMGEKMKKMEGVERKKLIHLETISKSGAMICQQGKYLFFLVETCRDTPIGGTWEECEAIFLSYITKPGETITVLNANCGGMRYRVEERKG